MKVKHVALPDIWRICNKIRAAIFRINLNLYDYFKPLDLNNNCLISGRFSKSRIRNVAVSVGKLGTNILNDSVALAFAITNMSKVRPALYLLFFTAFYVLIAFHQKEDRLSAANKSFKLIQKSVFLFHTEKQFISVLGKQIRNHIGLSDQEISELADYFRVQDGRIFYTQLCEIIHKSVPDFDKNLPLVSGLEWEDPLHENALGPAEERRVDILMTKIASLVNTRQLILRPFFQDYELISKTCGTITIAHFGRILYFLGIHLCADEFNLLVKKYLKDSYTISYNAFLAKIDAITKYWEKHGFTDLGGDLLKQFPGRIINAELPKLPRPEIDVISTKDIYGYQKNFHPSMDKPPPPDDLVTTMKRIQKYVFTNGIRTTDFFQGFDHLNSGKITCNQFRRGLNALIYRGMYFSEYEIWQIIVYYRDPNDSERVCWRTFADDVDQVYTTKELEKWPECQVEQFPRDVQDLCKKGQAAWVDVEPRIRDLCEETLEKIRQKISKRRLCLKADFKAYDKLNTGHVARAQYRQVLTSNNILLADEEMTALEMRFNDEMGFNYYWFLNEVNAKPIEEPLYNEYVKKVRKVNCREEKEAVSVCERDIVMILGKIKAKVVRERIDIYPFLREHDQHNERCISIENFVRGLAVSGINLTETELEVLTTVFAAPGRKSFVDYVTFTRTIDEAFTQAELERAPLVIPTPFYPSESNPRNFLNFEERHMVAVALEKLASVGDRNLDELFADYDRQRCGTITKQQFINGLSVRNMRHLISTPETDSICKAFSYLKGVSNEVDYKAFLRALDILNVNLKRKPV